MRFSRQHQTTHEREEARTPLPDNFWCVECDGSGFVPATIVSRTGRVNEMSVACHCEAGVRYGRSAMTYSAAVRAGILDEDAGTKQRHWLHSKLRFFELTDDQPRLEELRAMIASGNPVEFLRAKWATTPPQGPLAGTTKVVTR
jgi:hypothetical protein